MENLCQLLWLTLLCFKITFVWGSFMIANNAVDHIPLDKCIITPCWTLLKCNPPKMFDRVTCRPNGFLCGKHSTTIDDGIIIPSVCVLILASGIIYYSTATNRISVYGSYVFDRVRQGLVYDRICISWSKRLSFSRIKILRYVLETHYHVHLMRWLYKHVEYDDIYL